MCKLKKCLLSSVLIVSMISNPVLAADCETDTDASTDEKMYTEELEFDEDIDDEVVIEIDEHDGLTVWNKSEEYMFNKIWSLRSEYPECMPWHPTKAEPLKDCYWFAIEIGNRLFDNTPVAKTYSEAEVKNIKTSQIHIGDILARDKTHLSVVVYKTPYGVHTVAGNSSNGGVTWYGFVSYDEMKSGNYGIWSRYQPNQTAVDYVRKNTFYMTIGESLISDPKDHVGYGYQSMNILKGRDELSIASEIHIDGNTSYTYAYGYGFSDDSYFIWDKISNDYMNYLKASKTGTVEFYLYDKNGKVIETSTIVIVRKANYYNINNNGGIWENERYYLNGQMVTDSFFCDGTYTYYLESNGAPMKDRLTYHPDGVHVIYFDENGHEVFSDFHHVKKSIAGTAVDDYCFFDVNGYMYVDVMTYDKTGKKLYYINPYGQIERNGWFKFSRSAFWAGAGPRDVAEPLYVGEGWGYANPDGTLMVNQWTVKSGKQVYMQGDGHMK